jgi:phytoene dehydrogenase-like protein
MKIGIIGAGIAGLATALRLAKKGHEVHVFEANSYAGGKLSEFTIYGKKANSDVEDAARAYRFDAGPSLFTMPMYVDELLEGAPKDLFSYQKLDVVCHYFWDDGTRMTGFSDPKKLAQEVENQLNVPRERVEKALKSAETKYNFAGRIFLEKSLHKISTWLSPKVGLSLILMPMFDIFKTMNKTHEDFVGKENTKLVQFFNRFATYNGSNPYRASGMLSVIPHFEHGIGAFYPKGGMFQIVHTLHELALRKGVIFKWVHFIPKVG